MPKFSAISISPFSPTEHQELRCQVGAKQLAATQWPADASLLPLLLLHIADPHEVSEQITRIVAAFRARLGMQPPSQLLSNSWTFTKALRLPDHQLQANLNGLLQLVGGDVTAAQQLAQQHAGVLLSPSFAGMLGRVAKLGQLLGLQQVRC
jgi:hypothetical protein